MTWRTVLPFFTSKSVVLPSASSVSTLRAKRSASRLTVEVRYLNLSPARQRTSYARPLLRSTSLTLAISAPPYRGAILC